MSDDFAHCTNHADACEIVNRNLTARAKRLQRLDNYVDGTQYHGMADWWSDAPLWERAPCIVDPIVRTAINSNVDLVLGEDRYPCATSRPDEDDTEEGLDTDQSEQLDKLVEQIEDLARYPSHCREALAQAQSTGTAVGLFGVRQGRPFADLIKAQWCSRDVDATGAVTKLVIQYPYLAQDPLDAKKCVVQLYRRDIDASTDTTYLPARLGKNGLEEDLRPGQVIAHNLGFCPVVWYAFFKGCGTVMQIDGHAVHEHICGQVDSLNYALSQKQHAAIYCGEPQPYEVGVDPGYCPTQEGDIADRGANEWSHGGRGAHGQNYRDPTARKRGRKKGPGYVWQYANKDTKVGYLTIPEGALKSMAEHCQDLRSKISESLAYVGLDPDQVKFAATVSGKALESLRARQLDRCDQIRDDFGKGYLLPGLDMLLRIVYTVAKRGGRIDIPALKNTLVVLDQFAQAE